MSDYGTLMVILQLVILWKLARIETRLKILHREGSPSSPERQTTPATTAPKGSTKPKEERTSDGRRIVSAQEYRKMVGLD